MNSGDFYLFVKKKTTVRKEVYISSPILWVDLGKGKKKALFR